MVLVPTFFVFVRAFLGSITITPQETASALPEKIAELMIIEE